MTKPIDSGNDGEPLKGIDPTPTPTPETPVAVSPGGVITIEGGKRPVDGCEIKYCFLICYSSVGINVSQVPGCTR